MSALTQQIDRLGPSVQELHDSVKEGRAALKELERQIQEQNDLADAEYKKWEQFEQVRQLFVTASLGSREYVREIVEEYMTQGLSLVFERDLRFILEFKDKRNQTEVDFRIEAGENGKEIRGALEDACGGGALDVMSVVLKLVVRNLLKVTTPFVLDEPTKFLNPISAGNQVVNFGRLLRELCAKADTQVILITHDKTLPEFADKGFGVTLRNGVSVVEELENTLSPGV